MDASRETVSTKQEVYLSWDDPHMRWDPSDYGGQRIFNVPLEAICCPAIVLLESFDIMELPSKKYSKHVMITSNGKVTFAFMHTYVGYCPMDVTYFPFDTQICDMTFYSLIQHQEITDIYPMRVVSPSEKNRTELIDNCECLRYYHGSKEWEMIKMHVSRLDDWVDDTVTGYDLTYSYIKYQMKIRRKPWYYIWSSILGSNILVSVTCIALFAASQSADVRQARPQVGLVALLSLAVQLNTGHKNQSVNTSYITGLPILSIYFIGLLLIVAVSVVINCGITHLHHVLLQQRYHVPSCCRCLLLPKVNAGRNKRPSKSRELNQMTAAANSPPSTANELERRQMWNMILTRVDYIFLVVMLVCTMVMLVWMLSHSYHEHPPQTVWGTEYGIHS